MAFDGITVAAVVMELKEKIENGRIYKIAQPEKDELLLTIKGGKEQYRLILSANPSLPLAYLTDENKVSPIVAPAFTMLLRKHIQNGRILSVTQPDFERIIDIEIEHLDELGDICRKHLIIELMGKYSNIIFTSDEGKIIDSIKRVNAMTSSVREVLPGLDYFVPKQEGKTNPLNVGYNDFLELLNSDRAKGDVFKVLYGSFTGISPMIASEICEEAHVAADTDISIVKADNEKTENLWKSFSLLMDRVREGKFSPVILYENKNPKDYSMAGAASYSKENQVEYESPSGLITAFYKEKETLTRAHQKSSDLRKIVQTILERDIKKYDLQLKQLKDTDKMEKYRVYGELLHTYGHSAVSGDKNITVDNYYTGEKLTIPLDENLSPMENAKKYFDKYNKLKRTKEALESLTIEVGAEIEHLESILTSLEYALKEEDLNEIKEELIEFGYIKRKGEKKGQNRFKSKPLHYISSDGFHMYVGKNNFQNDELTFKIATGNDWWFHAKGMPGSHVIVKSEGEELPDGTFEEAARLAAHYSKGAMAEKVEIDYLQKKNVKKPNGSKPGFVVYYTNYSMMIDSDISGIEVFKE